MHQETFILYCDRTEYVSKKIVALNPHINLVYSENNQLTDSILLSIARRSSTPYFYIISTDKELIFNDNAFSYIPPKWDSIYVHIWNNDINVRLFYRDNIIDNPSLYDDVSLSAGKIRLKNIEGPLYTPMELDIVFLSYKEPTADISYNNLLSRFPSAKRVSGIKGIHNAHRAAAELASTDMFYVVDADAEIVPEFSFNYQPSSVCRSMTHIWAAKNPVNGLIYGYGGVKLFPRNSVLNSTINSVDFTSAVTPDIVVLPEVSNITRFNVDPLSTWRSAFRECAKLSSSIIPRSVSSETEYRLKIWKTIGKSTEFGGFAISGAIAGEKFGKKYSTRPDMLGLINDYKWLEDEFNKLTQFT